MNLQWLWQLFRAGAGGIADQLSVAHAYWIGRHGVVDTDRAIAWAERAARARSPEAGMLLGVIYTDRNAPGDSKAAFESYRRAAEEGYAPAQQSVAICFERGSGVAQSLPAALEWYRAAADGGEVDSQLAVARLLLDGTAGEADPAEARRYALMARRAGAVEADTILAAIPVARPQ